jgi:ABC-type Fe3+/spermidine/putrescine transport system ATPase subunit
MLDEPLGSLDRGLRDQLLADLRHILAADGTPALYVTHDQEEALAIADRLLLIREGQIRRSGTPTEVYSDPRESWVAQFLSLGTLVPARVRRTSPLLATSELGELAPHCKHPRHRAGDDLTLLLRRAPASVRHGTRSPRNTIRGTVAEVSFRGDSYHVTLDCSGRQVTFDLPLPVGVGHSLSITLPPEAILCLK